jgi:translation initiation factor 4E
MSKDEVSKREDGEIGSTDAPDTGGKKHPLEHSWTLWFDNPKGSQSKNTWGQTLRAVYTFSTVEDFWCLYNNIKPPSWLQPGTDFHLFKEGIQPKWEDPSCENGGKWTILVPRGNKQILDKFWLHSLLACIGEQFNEGEEVCGVVVNMRQRQDKVCLWTKTASNEAVQVSVGKQFKEFLEYDSACGFLAHSDAKSMDKKAKDRYTI